MTNPPGSLRLVLVPAVLCLLVSVARVLGEVQGWAPLWFGEKGKGGGALVGISWLIPVFGFWFGWKHARAGQGPALRGRAVWLPLVAFVLIFAWFGISTQLLKLSFVPSLLGVAIVAAIAGLLAALAWPRLAWTTFLFGVFARVPVVGIIYLAASRSWDVHYLVMPPNAPQDMPMNEKAFYLSVAQLVFWVPGTMIFGGFFGGLAALVSGRGRAPGSA